MFSGARRARAGAASGPPGLSVIGAGMVMSGDVVSSAIVHIEGRVDGNVRCDSLILGGEGVVAGNIEADQVRISGFVDGTVRGRIVTLEPSARVTGDVTYETLSIAAGAAIDGRLARREKVPAPASLEPPAPADPMPERKLARRTAQPVLPALEAPAVVAG